MELHFYNYSEPKGLRIYKCECIETEKTYKLINPDIMKTGRVRIPKTDIGHILSRNDGLQIILDDSDTEYAINKLIKHYQKNIEDLEYKIAASKITVKNLKKQLAEPNPKPYIHVDTSGSMVY